MYVLGELGLNMKKILITGFSGFVSRHFIHFLYENKICMEVYGIDICEPKFDYKIYSDILHIEFNKINMLNIDELRSFFVDYVPDYILHLASFSSVAYSWKSPAQSFSNNTNIFLNLVSTVKEFNRNCRILSVGSSEEYGNVDESDLPIKESQKLRPISPYAVARVAQEMLSNVYVESYHLDIIMSRSFNHIGPWQDNRFVVPGFIERVLELEQSGKSEGIIETGDISIVRDFVDVRDVVRAYYTLLMHGKSGEIYNFCSGRGISLRDIIKIISNETGIKICTRVNPEYIRLNDNKIIIGSPNKMNNELGWNSVIPIEQTIHDMVFTMKNDHLKRN